MAKAAPRSTAGTLSASTRVAVLHGPDVHRRSELTRELLAALTKTHGEFSRFDFDGETVSASQVLDELRSFGLMTTHKLVIVDRAEKFLGRGDARKLLEGYCTAPMEEATLLLRADRWNAGNLDKLIAAVGSIHACQPATPAEAVEWLTRHGKERSGSAIDRAAAELLVARVGSSLARIENELQKIATFAGLGVAITTTHVAELTPLTREDVVWLLQPLVMKGDIAGALEAVDRLVAVSRIPGVLLSFALIDALRKLHDGAALAAGGASAWDIGKALKLWGPDRDEMVAAVTQAARRNSRARLAALLHRSLQGVVRARSGGLVDERIAVELAIAHRGRE